MTKTQRSIIKKNVHRSSSLFDIQTWHLRLSKDKNLEDSHYQPD